jgi:hypothetical protein
MFTQMDSSKMGARGLLLKKLKVKGKNSMADQPFFYPGEVVLVVTKLVSFFGLFAGEKTQDGMRRFGVTHWGDTQFYDPRLVHKIDQEKLNMCDYVIAPYGEKSAKAYDRPLVPIEMGE